MALPDSPLVVRSVIVRHNDQFIVELRRKGVNTQHYWSSDNASWLNGVTGEYHIELGDPDVEGTVSLNHYIMQDDDGWQFLPVHSFLTYRDELVEGFVSAFFLLTIFKLLSYVGAGFRALFVIPLYH